MKYASWTNKVFWISFFLSICYRLIVDLIQIIAITIYIDLSVLQSMITKSYFSTSHISDMVVFL